MDSLTRVRIEKKIAELTKRLEMVYKTTRNPAQQKRVSIELAQLKKDLKRLEDDTFGTDEIGKYINEDDLGLSGDDADSDDMSGYAVLSTIPITPLSQFCGESDVNRIHSFLKYFEDEYWGAISDYQLKLDFNYSQKRDAFYNDLNTSQMAMKKYSEILHDLYANPVNRDYEEKLRMMRSKLYMDLIIKTGDFVRKLRDFIKELLDDYRSGGNLILNPENVLPFDSIRGTRALEGRTNVEAMETLDAFLEELYGFMNIGSLKQFHRDDQE